MPIIKKTDAILNQPWNDDSLEIINNSANLPPRLEWDYSKNLTINDVTNWEQLYYEFGNVGIYASWDPYAEFFIIVFNLFLDSDLGIETFYGQGSNRKVLERAKELGIELQENQIWIDEKNAWLYKYT
jgi:hypothetical protein